MYERTFHISGTGLGLADGCPQGHEDALPPKPEVDTFKDEGIVRCCSKNGDSCISPEGNGYGKCPELKYKEAVDMCANIGRRLCTSVELAIGLCCDALCQSLLKYTWHSGEVKGE